MTTSAGGTMTVTGVLEPRGPAAALLLTEEQVAALGVGKTPPVHVVVDGHGEFDGRIGRMGGEIMLGFNKAVRTALGVAAGDELHATLTVAGPPQVELPPALADALAADDAARAGFDALAPSHRKEWARWVGEAKRDETRDRRVAEAVEKLREGKPRR